MQIELSSNFLKKAKKLPGNEQILLSKQVDLFRKNPRSSKLKTHALTGRLRGLFSFSLTYSKRVIFLFLTKDKALLIDVGSHEEVYR